MPVPDPNALPDALADTITHSPFLTLNREMLEQVATFIDFAAERLTIGFVSVNFAKDRQTLIEALRQHPRTQEAELAELAFPDPTLHFLRDEIFQALPTIPRQPDKKLVLLITGLEQSIGMVGDYPPVLQDLNYVRDAFTHSVPHPMLVFLPDRALTRLARFAPDFWAWRMAVFTFKSLPETVDRAFQETLRSDKPRESLDLAARQERIDLLLRLSMEYDPKSKAMQPNLLAYRTKGIEILRELGIIHHNVGEVQKAEYFFHEALSSLIDEENETLNRVKASVLHHLGMLYIGQGKIEQSIALYQKSLALYESIEDVQGKAVLLHNLAAIHAQQGQVVEAIALYQQSLDLDESIDDVQDKAASLHQLAGIYAQQGQTEEAIALYQQSLALKESIGDVQGKAASLHNLASIYAQQGQTEEAIALYQQSLMFTESIGNVRGKAASLHNLASIYAQQGQTEEAIALYQQSLALKDSIGNVQGKAASLHGLACIYAQRGQVVEAIDLFKQSLEIEERIGHAEGKAMTLWWLGHLAKEQGNSEAALPYLQEAVEILRQIKSPNAAKVQKMIDRIQGR